MSPVLAEEKGLTFTKNFLFKEPVRRQPSTSFNILSPTIKASLFWVNLQSLSILVFSFCSLAVLLHTSSSFSAVFDGIDGYPSWVCWMFSIVGELLFLWLRLLTFVGIAISATLIRFTVTLFISVTFFSNSAVFVCCLAIAFS